MNYGEMLEKCVVAVCGDVMLDRYVWGEVHRISPEAPVPVVNVGDRSHVLGGAANVAANLAGLGVEAHLLGVVGGDEAGRLLASEVETSGMRGHLLPDTLRPTTVKTRIMAGGQQLLRMDEESREPLSAFQTELLFREFSAMAPGLGGVILSDYGKGVLVEPVCRRIIGSCKGRGIPVLVDPKGRDWDRYRGATCVTPNLKEFQEYVGTTASDGLEMAARAEEVRSSLELDAVVVTLGPRGLLVVEAGGRFSSIPARAKEVFDVSGAGDTLIASLAAFVAAGLEWHEAAMLANAAAGVVVGKIGTCAIRLDELEAAVPPGRVPGASRNGSGQQSPARIETR